MAPKALPKSREALYSQDVIRLWMILVLMLTAPCFGQGPESSAAEDHAFETASKSFADEFWARAEQEWRDFTIRFPLSARVPQAVLYQAQSLIALERYTGAVQLLQDNLAQAGDLRDEYLFWIAESHFRAGHNTAAAEAFAQLVSEFPASQRALEALLGQAGARARMEQWTEVITVLEDPQAGIAHITPSVANHLLLARAWLLLAEAYLANGNHQTAEATLQSPALEELDDSLSWQKRRLSAAVDLAAKRYDEALAASSNLVLTASGPNWRSGVADAYLFQGQVWEAIGDVDAAALAYGQNLTTNTPPAVQRQTLLRLSKLLIENERLDAARSTVERFLGMATDPEAADLARLTLAELKLRQYMNPVEGSDSQAAPPNLLEQVIADLNAVTQAAPSRSVRGKAFFYLGWAEWLRGVFDSSSAAFEQATELLAPSEDRLVARFKVGDCLFRMGQFEPARQSYQAVAASAPGVGGRALSLIEPALYQSLRASLELSRADLATHDLGQLLEAYPDGFYASTSVLLTGHELGEAGDPAGARRLFEAFLKQAPGSSRAPEIRLAIARTYEAQADWAPAIEVYDSLAQLTNAPSIATQAKYFRARDTAHLGDETTALSLFSRFVAAHPNSPLAPRAQWWIGDYHWRQGDYINAELNFQLLFQNWPDAGDDLAYEARMMAGRAAMARLNPEDAIPYFTNLTSDLKCPPDLKPKAMFAYGDALIRLGSTATNDPYANYASAIKVFTSIDRNYPSNDLAARAEGRVGDCYLQLARTDPRLFQSASNAYDRALQNPRADVSTRSLAEVGLATVLEAQAEQGQGASKAALLELALDHHLNVFYEKNLQEGEAPDAFLIKRAGLEAGRLAETLGLWTQARNIYQRLLELLPVMKPLLENKILKTYQADGLPLE